MVNSYDNLLSQKGSLNQGAYSHEFEKSLEDDILLGKKVGAKVKIEYTGDSMRPDNYKCIKMVELDTGETEVAQYFYINK